MGTALLKATVTADASHAEDWPVVVIGGGPAGVVAATRLADADLRVLLVEAKRFPRDKVCGGCLNRRAIAALTAAGFWPTLANLHGLVTRSVRLQAGGRFLDVPTPEGLALTRRAMDAALLEEAVRRGVTVEQGVRATVLREVSANGRRVRLSSPGGATRDVGAAVVLAADGLGAPSLSKLPEFVSQPEQGSRIGCGALLPEASVAGLADGQVLMAAGPHGYVGVVRCEAGRVNAAAAFDARRAAAADSLGRLAQQTLDSSGVAATDAVAAAAWRGTRRLTQAAQTLAAERLLVIGDAAGYVEPFTGEGMAAAIEDALAVAPLAVRAAHGWRPEIAREWAGHSSAARRARQRDIRRLAWLLRRPWAARTALSVATAWPALGERVARRVSAP